jgi:DNA-binding CsgD family transcriptional regulator
VKRIAILSPSPLWASGIAAALSAGTGWQLVESEDADAVVMLAGEAALPPGVPAVVLGDDLREFAAPGEGRPLALLAREATPETLRAAVAAVLQGLSVRDASLPFAFSPQPGDHEPLTARELEVFELLGKGLSNRDIGGVLGISAHTAKYHVGQILAKVGAATRAEAVRSGLQMGLIGL